MKAILVSASKIVGVIWITNIFQKDLQYWWGQKFLFIYSFIYYFIYLFNIEILIFTK